MFQITEKEILIYEIFLANLLHLRRLKKDTLLTYAATKIIILKKLLFQEIVQRVFYRK